MKMVSTDYLSDMAVIKWIQTVKKIQGKNSNQSRHMGLEQGMINVTGIKQEQNWVQQEK